MAKYLRIIGLHISKKSRTFAPEKACPDGQSRWRRDFRTKGKRRDKKGDLPTAVLKKTAAPAALSL